MVGGIIYYVHQPVYERILPDGGDYNEKKFVEDISCTNFEAVLKFLYTEDTKDLSELHCVDRWDLEAWAIKNKSWVLLSGVLLSNVHFDLNSEILPLIALVYSSWYDIPQFRERFRQELKKNLENYRKADVCTRHFVSEVVGHLQDAPRAIEDVTQVLNDLWTNAASGTSLEEQMRHCGGLGDEECSGYNGEEYDCEPTSEWEDNEPGERDHGVGQAFQSECANRNDWNPPESDYDTLPSPFPIPMRVATETVMPPPSNMNTWNNGAGSPGPPVNHGVWACWDNQESHAGGATPYNNYNGDDAWGVKLQRDQARGAASNVAGRFRCNENAALYADEAISGPINYTKQPLWEDSEMPPQANRATTTQASRFVNSRPKGTEAALDATSALARCIYHWLEKQGGGCGSCSSEFNNVEVGSHVGCTVAEAQAALDELHQAGVVDFHVHVHGRDEKKFYQAKGCDSLAPKGGW